MPLKPCHLLVLVLPFLPATGVARGDYPPSIPDAEVMPFKTIGELTLNLYVFKPEGWKASDKRPAARTKPRVSRRPADTLPLRKGSR